MKKGTLRLATMIAGSLLTIAIVFAQITGVDSSCEKESVKTEQSDSGAQTEILISLPSFSLPAPVTLSSSFDGQVLFEILFDVCRQETSESPESKLPEKLLVTLFQVIISPNAP